METLESLRRDLSELTRWREATIKAANETIVKTNAAYDKMAMDLHRKIKKLLPPEEVTPVAPVTRNTRKARKRTPVVSLEGTDGWSQDEIDHYRELVTRQ